MRFYSFTNFYFQGIHAGIQTGHAVHAMETKYRHRIVPRSKAFGSAHAKRCLETYHQWSDIHKTIIVKKVVSPDAHAALESLYEELTRLGGKFHLPTVLWSEPSANNCNTAVGIVVPEYIINTPAPQVHGFSVGPNGNETLTGAWSDEYKIARILSQYSMAS